MRQVKLLMIGRHILAWLWLMVWLTASPGAHACVASLDGATPAFAATDGQGAQHCNEAADVRFQALRASRRIEFQSDSTDPLAGAGLFDAGVARQNEIFGRSACGEASLGPVTGWQFLQRAALSPRAPSFNS